MAIGLICLALAFVCCGVAWSLDMSGPRKSGAHAAQVLGLLFWVLGLLMLFFNAVAEKGVS